MTLDPTALPADLAAAAAEVEAYLATWLDRRPLPENLRSAIAHVLLGGGKRVRPYLTLRACAAVGGDAKRAMAAAAAMEMVHTFSLVHDDLPAMDDAPLRRGRPTLHVRDSEAMALLAGDALLSLAFELLADRIDSGELSGSLCGELAAATNDMIAGQVYDTLPDFPPDTPPMARLETIHRNKTGALIRCACRMGAICGDASADSLASITAYAEAVGLMFQVVDDLLDVTQTTEQLGKVADRDADHGKLTYPALIGLEASRAEINRQAQTALDALAPLGPPGDPLRRLCGWLAVRTR